MGPEKSKKGESHLEIDAGAITPAWLREHELNMATLGLGAKPGRAYIVNEAHGLRKDSIRALLVLLERLPDHCAVIFTTTSAGQEMLFEDCIDSGPLLSRCLEVKLTEKCSDAFAQRCMEIAGAEGLNGRPLKAYVELAKDCRNNFRRMLERVAAGEMAR